MASLPIRAHPKYPGWMYQKKSPFERDCKHTRATRNTMRALDSKEPSEMRSALRDLETAGPTRKISLDAYHPDSYIVGFCFSRSEDEGIFFPVEHRGREDVQDPFLPDYDKLAIRGLLRILFDACPVVTHNGKFDVRFVTATFGIYPSEIHFDTKLACFVVDGKDGKHDLKYLAGKYLKFGNWDEELNRYLAEAPTSRRTFEWVPLSVISRYGAIDAVATHRLVPALQQEKLHGKVKTWILLKRLCEAMITFNEIEVHGNRVDSEEWEHLTDDYLRRADRILDRVRRTKPGQDAEEKIGEKINLNSSEYLRILIHDCMRVPTNDEFLTDKTKEPSMADDALIWMIEWAENIGRPNTAAVIKHLRHAKDGRVVIDNEYGTQEIMGEKSRLPVGRSSHGGQRLVGVFNLSTTDPDEASKVRNLIAAADCGDIVSMVSPVGRMRGYVHKVNVGVDQANGDEPASTLIERIKAVEQPELL